MPTKQRTRLSWTKRIALTAVATTATAGFVATTNADATVYSTCTLSTCAAGQSAATTWASKGWPTTAGWYSWPDGKYNYTGGVYHNYDGQLPASATYHEYDVYSRAKGAARDAYRIIHSSTGTVYFSPDHYADFYQLP